MVRRHLSVQPWIYFPVARALGNRQLLTSETNIVIDGFPRSGNSYVEAAFRYSQRHRPYVLANHAHAGAQIIAAVRIGIPAIVLYRHPDNVVASYLEMIDGRMPPASLYRDFGAYYRSIEPYHEAILPAEFDVCIRDFSVILSRANAKFGVRFNVPQIDNTFHRNVAAYRDEISRKRIGRIPRFSDRNDPDFRKWRSERRLAASAQIESLADHPSRIAAMKTYETFRALDRRMHP